MPIFEYRCSGCGESFEQIIFNSSSQVACPKCGSQALEKLLSVFAVAASRSGRAAAEPGPCACGAPRRGMCSQEPAH